MRKEVEIHVATKGLSTDEDNLLRRMVSDLVKALSLLIEIQKVEEMENE